MTDRSNEEPLSSEELLRRARDELVRPPSPSDPAAPGAPTPEAAAQEPSAQAQQRPSGEAPTAEPPAPASDTPLIPADFQPAAARGKPAPPASFEVPPDQLQGGPIGTEQPGLGSQLWARRGWIVGGVFLAILAFSYFTGATSVEDLAAGDCFNDPGTEAISEVDTVDCNEPHDYEMFASVLLVGNNGAWPGDFELFEEAYETCLEPFLIYTGVSPNDEVYIWQYDAFAPTEASWAEGGRDALCTLYQVDEDFNPVPATTSARAGG